MKIAVETARVPGKEYSWPNCGEFVGFTKIAEIEWANQSYQFDITGVWRRDSDGTLWTADDSGCSCPTPWENTTELERLFDLDDLTDRYKSVKGVVGSYDDYVNPAEWEAFRDAVQAELDELK